MRWPNGNFHIRSLAVFWYQCISCKATVPGQCHYSLFSHILVLSWSGSSSILSLSLEGPVLFLGADFLHCDPFSLCVSLAGSLPVFGFLTLDLLAGLSCHIWPFPEDGAYSHKTFFTSRGSPLPEFKASLLYPQLMVIIEQWLICRQFFLLLEASIAFSRLCLCGARLTEVTSWDHRGWIWQTSGGCWHPWGTSVSMWGSDGPLLA